MKTKTALILALVSMVTAATALAETAPALTVTYVENPGAVNSSLQGTSVTDFSAWAKNGAGAYKNLSWTGVGTIDQVYLQKANLYGGATGSGYYAVDSASPSGVGGVNAVSKSTLTLNTPSSYFGLWWSAGDPYNTLSFYSGNTLIASFDTKSVLNALPKSYFGNPTSTFSGQDKGEPFAFLNVYGKPGVTWDKVVFSNAGTSGFESDNWTVRQQAWGTLAGESGAAPGVAVATVSGTSLTLVTTPEPAHVVGVFTAGILAVAVARKKRSEGNSVAAAA
jgi:hypothetical protein